jgi:tetratricopeptide (TPR) repeat protein
MPPEKDIERRLRELGNAVGDDDSLAEAVMARIHKGQIAAPDEDSKSRIQLVVRRLTMNRFVKFAVAATVIVAIIGGISSLGRFGSKAYAIDQTVEALRNVRYMHIVKHDKAGNLEDERWEEIDPNGYQARYRQNTPSNSFYVVDDRQTVMVYHADKDKNTAILYDPKDQSYTWHYAPGKMFDEIAEGKPAYVVVAENVQYKGRPAHHLRAVALDADVYIDPTTKLPMAMGDYEFSYEEPPQGTFDIVTPEGAIVVDRRPGAKPGPEPQWMVQEREKEELGKAAQAAFEQGRRALAAGDYPAAVDALTKAVELSPGRNWAWFWLGKTLCDSGKYDEAIYRLTRVIEMTSEHGMSIPSYYLARATAYQGKGMTDMAQIDFEKALPKMIESLRNLEAAWSFDLADDPLRRADGMREGCHEAPTPEQSVAMMINRLRIFTGQNFGYDAGAGEQDKEQAIAAWEQWAKSSGRMKFTPDAKLLPIPQAPAMDRE